VTVQACTQQAIKHYLLESGWATEELRLGSRHGQEILLESEAYTGLEIHPDSDSLCTGACFPGGKAAEVPD